MGQELSAGNLGQGTGDRELGDLRRGLRGGLSPLRRGA